MKRDKLLILFIMAIVYFVPALFLMERYRISEIAMLWLSFGWMAALVVGAFLET